MRRVLAEKSGVALVHVHGRDNATPLPNPGEHAAVKHLPVGFLAASGRVVVHIQQRLWGPADEAQGW